MVGILLTTPLHPFPTGADKMSVSIHQFRSHTGKSTAVTVAQSLHGGGCLIVGCEQIANLSVVIKDNEEAITGLFFDNLTSSEMLTELSNQTTLHLETFQTVIFTPSCHDVSIEGDLDVTYTVRLKQLFNTSDLYVCDYIYSPKQICMGLLSIIRQANVMIDNLTLPVLKISSTLLESDYASTKTLEIPICDYFLEEKNTDKSSVTVRGCNVFQQKLLNKLISKNPLMSSASFDLNNMDIFPPLSTNISSKSEVLSTQNLLKVRIRRKGQQKVKHP